MVALGKETSVRLPLVCEVPHGTILSLMLFNSYMSPFTQRAWSLGLGYHQVY